MDTPLIDPYVGNLAERFQSAKQTIERGLAQKHIWNTEYESAKNTISRVVEGALDGSSEAYRTPLRGGVHGGHWPAWENNDPRWMVVYHPMFAHTPGAAKKLQKFKGKEGAEFDHFILTVEECAKLAEEVKQIKPYIQKGRKPSENPKEIDLTQTGLCPICGRRQKLTNDMKMVDHGFQISDGLHYYGSRVGHCFGVGYPCYELSKDGCAAFKTYLLPQLKRTKVTLAELQSGTVETVSEILRKREGGVWKDTPVTYKKGENGFDRVLQNHLYRAEQQVEHLESDIATMDEKIKQWKKQSLKYGVYEQK